MRDVEPFEAAYGRLSETRVVLTPRAGPSGEPDAGRSPPSGKRETPRSRLLPRLALLPPKTSGLRRSVD